MNGECFLGLGSNLDQPIRQIRRAIQKLNKLPGCYVLKVAKIYQSQPLGVNKQPVFYNTVVLLNTNLPPLRLLDYCQQIEKEQERIKKIKWGPRTIDIDILLYGKLAYTSKKLVIPHPQIIYRDFAIKPLLELNSTISLPNGQLLQDFLPSCHRYVKKHLLF